MAQKETHYLLVLSNPTPGAETEYNRWYDEQHVPDVLKVAGMVSAQRYRLSDVQLGPTPAQRYLVIYTIETADLDAAYREVIERLADGRTAMSRSFDGGSAQMYTFTPLGPRIFADR